MTLWIAIAVLTVIAFAIIVVPMMKSRKAMADRAEYDVDLYKEQLKELDRELETGLLEDSEAGAARQELQRRLLIADGQRSSNSSGGEERVNTLTLGLSLAVVAVASVALYLYLGQPQLPDFPIAKRDLQQEESARADTELNSAVANLKQRLKENPKDLMGWRMLARSFYTMEQYAKAAEAFKKAAELTDGDKEAHSAILTNYAEALLFANDGKPSEVMTQAIATAHAADKLNMKAWFYSAFFKYKAGDVKGALQDWVNMKAVAPADAAWLPQVETQILQAAEALGAEAASMKPTPGIVEELNKLAEAAAHAEASAQPKEKTAAPTGPTAEQVKAASSMSDDEQKEMIRSMVERLAARLEENPDDKQGWMRLAKAYRVLGETEKAAEAEKRAAGGDGKIALQLPKGASDDLKTMVEGLRKRMEENPKDLEGWLLLGRTMLSMGEIDKAVPSFAKAAELAPDNKDVLTEYASSILSASKDSKMLQVEFVAVMKKIEAIDPEDGNVLWYLGLAEKQAGRNDGALSYWSRLLTKLTPETVPYARLKSQIDALGGTK